MTTSINFPLVMTSAGPQPTAPTDILNTLLTTVAATNPGYTANLPGSLIEDISSTDVAAIALCNQAMIDLVNSVSPTAANPFLLNQLGTLYGVSRGTASNTSVYVVFTGPAGFGIPVGFTVSDGTYQYVVQDGGVVGTGNVTLPLYCVATKSGTWAVPAYSVTQLITSVPTAITLSATNPAAGLPSSAAETDAQYRAVVVQAGLAASQGMATYLKTLLNAVPGVQQRLVSVRQQSPGWEVICGGGDPYQVAYAIYSALFDVSVLVGSVMSISGFTNANPGVVTTTLNHGLTTGAVVTVAGSTVSAWNGSYTITVIDQKTFSVGVNTSSFTTYVSGGVVTPNPRNLSATIIDYPDTYTIPFVNPPQQSVTMTVTWNTSVSSFTQQAAVTQLGAAALIAYVNAIPVGAPMNLFELQVVFQNAIASLIPPALLTRMVFAVDINGIGVSPSSGTGIIAGDPESYFQAAVGSVTVTQG